MPRIKGKHLSRENREVIESGIRNNDSARAISRRIDVSPSTVIREVKAHRTVRVKTISPKENASLRCAKRESCQASATACPRCFTKFTTCKNCKTKRCIFSCPEYEPKVCKKTQSWPYVCPEKCPKHSGCSYPKCSYDAADADKLYRETLSSARSGICATQAELDAMNAIVIPLSKQGQSFEAIWSSHAKELPVCIRSAYKYQELGALGLTSLDMPRKARLLPRSRTSQENKPVRERVDRTGRTYDDFNNLPIEEKVRVVQGDSVVGFQTNTTDILSLHIVSRSFQFYLKKTKSKSKDVVTWLDVIERALGSPEVFEEIFGVLLVDRGCEFDDWEGMERSCLIKDTKRCRVFYCDQMNSNQKSQAERNHEQLRRILPKNRSDFDKLHVWDVVVCCSHVNSYPLVRKTGTIYPIEAVRGLVPQRLLDELGIERIPADEVVLKPYLMAHAVKQ